MTNPNDDVEKAAREYENKIDMAHKRCYMCCYSGCTIEDAFLAGAVYAKAQYEKEIETLKKENLELRTQLGYEWTYE